MSHVSDIPLWPQDELYNALASAQFSGSATNVYTTTDSVCKALRAHLQSLPQVKRLNVFVTSLEQLRDAPNQQARPPHQAPDGFPKLLASMASVQLPQQSLHLVEAADKDKILSKMFAGALVHHSDNEAMSYRRQARADCAGAIVHSLPSSLLLAHAMCGLFFCLYCLCPHSL